MAGVLSFLNISFDGCVAGTNLGTLNVDSDGIAWTKRGGVAERFDKSELSSISWKKVSNRNQLGVWTEHGTHYNFIGFQDQDFDTLNTFIQSNYEIALEVKHLTVGKDDEYNPYKRKYDNMVKAMDTRYYWDESRMAVFPGAIGQVPNCGASLALTYHTGFYVRLMKTMDNAPNGRLILHALFEPIKLTKQTAKELKGKEYGLKTSHIRKLENYSPRLNHQTGLINKNGRYDKYVQRELYKHLPGIPFLNKRKYWPFVFKAYEDLEIGGLLLFIKTTAKERHLLGEHTLPGWWTLTLRSFVTISHEYKTIKSGGFRLSFKVFKHEEFYYLREISVSLEGNERITSPAARPKSMVVCEEVILEGSSYINPIPFDAILYFKD